MRYISYIPDELFCLFFREKSAREAAGFTKYVSICHNNTSGLGPTPGASCGDRLGKQSLWAVDPRVKGPPSGKAIFYALIIF